MNKIFLFALSIQLVLILMVGCKTQTDNVEFISVQNGKFIKNGQAYNYIGANYWYGASLAADTVGGDRERLAKELDFLKENGIDNLRVSVGAEGPDNQPFRVTPALVKEPGVYSPKLLEGLDYLLNELQKRDMCAILYLTNNWEWSGGMAQYLNWNGYGEFVNPNLEQYSWDDFYNYQKQFYSCDTCIQQVNQYIEYIVTRTNTVNGLKYTNDPSIMAWELANEPRPMAEDNFEPFTKWVKETSELIKSLDQNHLVTTGNEGEKGCSESLDLFETIHALPSIDYLTFHIWIKNWSWYNHEQADSTFPIALQQVQKYIDDHMAVAQKLNKPLVLEEFGIARDNELFEVGTPVTYRDKYYDYAFGQISKSIEAGKNLVGANFWTFGGFTHPISGQIYWKAGDPYSGDPPQEEQGLNSVYPEDTSTIDIIRKYNKQFNRIP
ncbi:MAG: cellulase family glycosylhydrolase [Salinivirgaceae bacterium]|jgi:mannan endo-1,4-beta-mannosidase|nr:cellulase family glycosylhydrolase [Salinivirgaceae bacterium]